MNLSLQITDLSGWIDDAWASVYSLEQPFFDWDLIEHANEMQNFVFRFAV